MQSAEIRQQRPADHDVMKVRDDEVRIAQVHIGCERRDEHSRQPADREQTDEAEAVQHRRVVRD